jgi:PAS domain-containing protein
MRKRHLLTIRRVRLPCSIRRDVGDQPSQLSSDSICSSAEHSIGLGVPVDTARNVAPDVRTSGDMQTAPRLAPFPRDDALIAHAQAALERLGPCSPDALERELRVTYPEVSVQPQSAVAQLRPQPVWYIFRDGHVRPTLLPDAWLDDALPAFVIGEDGTYLDANDAASRLLGVRVEKIRGARIGAFTRHEPTEDAGLRAFAVLARTGFLESTAVVGGPDGQLEVLVDYRITKTAEGGFRMVMRPRSPADSAGRSQAPSGPVL